MTTYAVLSVLFLIPIYLIIRSRWIESLSSQYLCMFFNAKRMQKVTERTSLLHTEFDDVFYSADRVFYRLLNWRPSSFIKSHYLFHIVFSEYERTVRDNNITRSYMKYCTRRERRAFRSLEKRTG